MRSLLPAVRNRSHVRAAAAGEGAAGPAQGRAAASACGWWSAAAGWFPARTSGASEMALKIARSRWFASSPTSTSRRSRASTGSGLARSERCRPSPRDVRPSPRGRRAVAARITLSSCRALCRLLCLPLVPNDQSSFAARTLPRSPVECGGFLRLKVRQPPVVKAVRTQELRGLVSWLVFLVLRLECVHRRAAKYPVRNVPGLDGFPVIHATQLVFKLAASFGEVDFSLLRSKQFCLESQNKLQREATEAMPAQVPRAGHPRRGQPGPPSPPPTKAGAA